MKCSPVVEQFQLGPELEGIGWRNWWLPELAEQRESLIKISNIKLELYKLELFDEDWKRSVSGLKYWLKSNISVNSISLRLVLSSFVLHQKQESGGTVNLRWSFFTFTHPFRAMPTQRWHQPERGFPKWCIMSSSCSIWNQVEKKTCGIKSLFSGRWTFCWWKLLLLRALSKKEMAAMRRSQLWLSFILGMEEYLWWIWKRKPKCNKRKFKLS